MAKDKQPSADTATPALPPQPLLAVPPSKIPVRVGPPLLVAGLAAPSPAAKQARVAAVAARDGIARQLTQGRALLAQLKLALQVHDASPEAQAEWQREGVDAGIVHAFADHLESAVQQFTSK